ncbi:MAG: hypothetical protein QOG04_1643 [Actinomycetota bacterium]|nr:hypothetical protein [Actinomycetota bacterium]
MTEDWTSRAKTSLGIDEAIDEDDVLDLARVVAHGVERKMAPVSTFLAGLAAGRAGGDPAAMRAAIEKLRNLAQS